MSVIIKWKRYLYNLYTAIVEYSKDARLYIHNSLIDGYSKTEDRFLGKITLNAHVIEKGITMPNRRFGFGQDKMRSLVLLCNEYVECGYNIHQPLFESAVSVISEYNDLHAKNNVPIEEKLQNEINIFLANFPDIDIHPQPLVKREEIFYRGDFLYVAQHRHCIRNFQGHVEEDKLRDAISLAQTSPSACNRQPVRVYVIQNTRKKNDLFETITSMQRGNRGFGYNADKLLIIAVEMDTYNGLGERNQMYVDGGSYTMNMMYSLQYYGISSCILSSALLPHDFSIKFLKRNEVVCSMLLIGNCPDEFLVARSLKRDPIVTTMY